jgi:hypothetical protein
MLLRELGSTYVHAFGYVTQGGDIVQRSDLLIVPVSRPPATYESIS